MSLLYSSTQFPTLALAAEGLRQFVKEDHSNVLQGRAPKFPDLWQAGRFDLSSVYKKFGKSQLQISNLQSPSKDKFLEKAIFPIRLLIITCC